MSKKDDVRATYICLLYNNYLCGAKYENTPNYIPFTAVFTTKYVYNHDVLKMQKS